MDCLPVWVRASSEEPSACPAGSGMGQAAGSACLFAEMSRRL